MEAFRVPLLKKEIEKVRLHAEKERLSCLQLEEKLSDEKAKHSAAIEEERDRYRAEITALIEQHRNTIAECKYRKNLIERSMEKYF